MRRAGRVALQLRLTSLCSASVAGPSRSIVDHPQRRSTVSISMLAEDEKLIRRSEFYEFNADQDFRQMAKQMQSEVILSVLRNQLRDKYRVDRNVILDLVLRLENGDAALISRLQQAPEQWIPMAIRCCGRALSSIQTGSRRVIASRLWKQIEERNLPISIESINALLRVNLENGENWNAWDILQEIEGKRRLVPDQETFRLLLENLSLSGETDECVKMTNEMARRGHPSDAISHSHLVYANAVRGHDQKTDSMIKQASINFGSEGEALSLGAACVAAAAGERIDRLNELLRQSEDDYRRIRLPIDSALEIIWKLSEKTGDNETKNEDVIKKLLKRTLFPKGVFHSLFREMHRHITAYHFRTSTAFLENMMRGKRAMKIDETKGNVVRRICRLMVSSKIQEGLMMEMANRMETKLPIKRGYVYSELMLSVLTLKEYDSDERFSSFSSLLPIVDPNKERPHLILPLIAATPEVDDRLKLIYHASSLGYSNLELLDTNLMSEYLFQPMYNFQAMLVRQRSGGQMNSILETMTMILHSFGVPKSSVWQMMNEWWKMRKEEEEESPVEMRVSPQAEEIQMWLRSECSSISVVPPEEAVPTLPLITKTIIEEAVEEGDSANILSLLSTHRWPPDANFIDNATSILKSLLNNQSNENIMQFLNALSREAACKQGRDAVKTPLHRSEILKILHHFVTKNRTPMRGIIDMAYELNRLFPNAVFITDYYFIKKLMDACFSFNENEESMTSDTVDEIIELLITLIRLKIVDLSQPDEFVTQHCVKQVLDRFGWESAVKLWLQLQSSFSLGNGMTALLSHSLMEDMEMDHENENIQFVLHEAQSCLPPSRIHAIYAAALVNNGERHEEAVEYFKKHGSQITPIDCVIAFQVTNELQFSLSLLPSESFLRTFPSLCLAHTTLIEKNEEEARNMLHSALKFCGMGRSGPLIVEIRDLFAQYGVEPWEKEKRRIKTTMVGYQGLVNRWIFSPEGFIQARADDEFIKEDEWKKFVREKELVGGTRV